jgi:GxxExxY protein
MPIILPSVVKCLTEDEFHALDYEVMRVAFDIQNALGCHLDERIYEHELLYRLQAEGIPARPQYPITLRHHDYEATLAVDLLVGESTVYELKSATTLAESHRAQALTYVLLTETLHGKLVNFGAPKVVGEFVSTTLTASKRREVTVQADRWCQTSTATRLKSLMLDLANDWGLFLSCSLYRQALAHFFGGVARVRQPIPLLLGQRQIGVQDLDAIDPDSLLVLTALKEPKAAEAHYRRLLNLTRRRWMYWINLCKRDLHFIALENHP